MATFYETFIELCIRKGISPRKACLEMGMAHSSPAAWKRRGGMPNSTTMAKISKYFNVDPSTFLKLDEEKSTVIIKYNKAPQETETDNTSEMMWLGTAWAKATQEEKNAVKLILTSAYNRESPREDVECAG